MDSVRANHRFIKFLIIPWPNSVVGWSKWENLRRKFLTHEKYFSDIGYLWICYIMLESENFIFFFSKRIFIQLAIQRWRLRYFLFFIFFCFLLLKVFLHNVSCFCLKTFSKVIFENQINVNTLNISMQMHSTASKLHTSIRICWFKKQFLSNFIRVYYLREELHT